MNQKLEIKRVPFMGTELMAARDAAGQIWAGVRWMCDGIGLSRGQRNNETLKIQKETVLSKGARKLMLPTNGGNQEVLCLKLDFVPLWLAKISITPAMEQETPELAARLMEYQLKAKDVLAAAFTRSNAAKQTKQQARPSLSAVTAAMKLQVGFAQAAGVAPEYILTALAKAYEPYGIDIPVNSLPEAQQLYECEAIAQELGVLSEKGKPHGQAIAAIIKIIGVAENEKKVLPFSTNAYSNVTVKYTRSVLERIRRWLEDNGYPPSIPGNGKSYKVRYKNR